MKKERKSFPWEGFTILGIFVLVVLLFIVSPLLGIWSVNTLFGLSIEYSFINWLAWIVLVLTINASNNR